MSFTGRFPPDFNKEYDLPGHADLPRDEPEFDEDDEEESDE